MRLFIPVDPGHPADEKDMRAAVLVALGDDAFRPYTSPGVVVRLRFLHDLPTEHKPTGLMPPIPESPALHELVWEWGIALTGILWASAGQVVSIQAGREWTRGPAGVEVTL